MVSHNLLLSLHWTGETCFFFFFLLLLSLYVVFFFLIVDFVVDIEIDFFISCFRCSIFVCFDFDKWIKHEKKRTTICFEWKQSNFTDLLTLKDLKVEPYTIDFGSDDDFFKINYWNSIIRQWFSMLKSII